MPRRLLKFHTIAMLNTVLIIQTSGWTRQKFATSESAARCEQDKQTSSVEDSKFTTGRLVLLRIESGLIRVTTLLKFSPVDFLNVSSTFEPGGPCQAGRERRIHERSGVVMIQEEIGACKQMLCLRANTHSTRQKTRKTEDTNTNNHACMHIYHYHTRQFRQRFMSCRFAIHLPQKIPLLKNPGLVGFCSGNKEGKSSVCPRSTQNL